MAEDIYTAEREGEGGQEDRSAEIDAEVAALDGLCAGGGQGETYTEPSQPRRPPSAAIPRMTTAAIRTGVEIRGRRRNLFDIYHWLLTTPWPLFAGVGFGSYLAINAVFAALYLIDPNGISGARAGNFADAFFFSVETIGTIGYGVLSPRGIYANTVMTLENFVGLSFVAVMTGVIFARVSRPTARVIFSKNALITTHEGQPSFILRAANERANQILEAEVTLSVTKQRRTAEGQLMRRFEDLKVSRSRSPLFALTWLIIHVIDEDSPLYGETLESMEESGLQVIVTRSGMDETFAQRIHARHAYLPEDLVWDRRFADVIVYDEDGRRIIDYGRFHDLQDL